MAEGAVPGHAAGDGDTTAPASARCPNRFSDKDLYDRGLDRSAKVADTLAVFQEFGMIPEEIADRGFEPAEAEVEIVRVFHRPGERKGMRITFPCQSFHGRSAGVGETKEFGGFVETFAGRVIQGFAQDSMLQRCRDIDQEGVSAADDEGDVRLKGFQVEPRLGFSFQPRGIEVAFMMMDRKARDLPGVGKGLGIPPADH